MNLFGKIILSAILLSLICASTLFSQPINHTGTLVFSKSTDVKDTDGVYLRNVVPPGGLSSSRFHYYVGYRISSLMGEPVVFCQAAVILEPILAASTHDSHPILERIRVIDINFYGAFEGGRYIIPCDVGSPKRPFIGSVNEFENLSNERKSNHLSFNVAGSPNWDELVHDSPGFSMVNSQAGVAMGWNRLNPESNYLSANESKKYLMNENFRFMGWFDSAVNRNGSFVEVAWDFSELEEYLAQNEKEREEEKLINPESKINEIQDKARKREQDRNGGGFWDQPDNALTDEDQKIIEDEEKNLFEQKERLRAIYQKIERINKKKSTTDEILSEKRRELQSRPSIKDKIKNNLVSNDEQYLGLVEVTGDYITLETWDHGSEDGDKVDIYTDYKTIKRSFTLKNDVTRIDVTLDNVQNKLSFKALNEGTSSPNTASFIVRDQYGNILRDNEWSLNTHDTAVIIVIKSN